MSLEKTPHVAHNSGNNEWYTPEMYITAVRDVMGTIDVDPASCDEANKTVGAVMYYTLENDGLVQKWTGNVFMNPPYGREVIGKFCRKFREEYLSGRMIQGIALVNNATETEWFSDLASASSAVVFPRGRVRFYGVSGERGAPLQGQAFLYAGYQTEKFIRIFSRFGFAARFFVPHELIEFDD